MEAQILQADHATHVNEILGESGVNENGEDGDSGRSSTISPVEELYEEGDEDVEETGDTADIADATDPASGASKGSQRRTRDVPCKKCGRLYSSENSLRNHIRIKHSFQPAARVRAQSSDGCVPIRAKSAPPPAIMHSVNNMLASAVPPSTIGPMGSAPDIPMAVAQSHLAATHSNPELSMIQHPLAAYPLGSAPQYSTVPVPSSLMPMAPAVC